MEFTDRAEESERLRRTGRRGGRAGDVHHAVFVARRPRATPRRAPASVHVIDAEDVLSVLV